MLFEGLSEFKLWMDMVRWINIDEQESAALGAGYYVSKLSVEHLNKHNFKIGDGEVWNLLFVLWL